MNLHQFYCTVIKIKRAFSHNSQVKCSCLCLFIPPPSFLQSGGIGGCGWETDGMGMEDTDQIQGPRLCLYQLPVVTSRDLKGHQLWLGRKDTSLGLTLFLLLIFPCVHLFPYSEFWILIFSIKRSHFLRFYAIWVLRMWQLLNTNFKYCNPRCAVHRGLIKCKEV